MDKPITVIVTGLGWLIAIAWTVTVGVATGILLAVAAVIAGSIAGTLAGEL